MNKIHSYVFAGGHGEFGTAGELRSDGGSNHWDAGSGPEIDFLGGFDTKKNLGVSSMGIHRYTMAVPGGSVDCAAICSVGTLPEYRRRGLVRRLMTQALEDCKERGQPVAILWPTQAAIYQRYGYAMVTVQREYEIDTVDIAFTDGDRGSCSVERIEHAEAERVCAALYTQFIAERSVYIEWDARFQKLGGWGSGSHYHYAVACDGSGTPVGYCIYSVRGGRQHKTRNQTLHIVELIWTTMDAYRSLWSFIASHDLVGAVRYHAAPADDPAPELFMEPRLLDAKDNEGMWLRIVDLQAALCSRRYNTAPLELTLVIEIVDDGNGLAEWNLGRWVLSVDSEGAATVAAAQSTDAAEISLTIKAMASLWTGFRSAAELHAWAELEGEPSAVTKAGLIFAAKHAPHCFDHY